MGDSYASSIGARDLPQGPDPKTCFRCRNAYPELIQSGQGSLRPNPSIFNYLSCSGATFPEILRYQLSDHDRPGRLAWGNAPEFVIITMGVNDVGILSLVLTCIYSIRIRVVGCDALLQRGVDVLDSEVFGEGIANVIRTVRDQGRRQYAIHIFVFDPNPNDDDTWFFQRGTTSNLTTTDGEAVTAANEGENAITQFRLNKTLTYGVRGADGVELKADNGALEVIEGLCTCSIGVFFFFFLAFH